MDSSPSRERIFLSYLAVVAAGVAAVVIYKETDPPAIVVDLDLFAVFAPFYIAAQAIERFLEPIAARVDTTTGEKAAVKQARTEKLRLERLPAGDERRSAESLAAADSAAEDAERALAKAKAQRAIPLWAAASSLAMIACALLGLGLIAAVSEKPPTDELVRITDVILTGLAVGAGTKPLHDLISRLEKAKDDADPATKPDPSAAGGTP